MTQVPELTHGFRIDEQECDGCLACMRICPTQAIRVQDGKARLLPRLCIDCGACEPECPVQAIFPDTDVPSEWTSYVAKNKEYFE